MVPGSARNGTADFEAFGRTQAVFIRRMMLLSLLSHGGVLLLGFAISPFFLYPLVCFVPS